MNICRELFNMVDVDAILVQSPSNVMYLSGYKSSDCQILITKNAQYFIADKRYSNEVSELFGNRFDIMVGDVDSVLEILSGVSKVGWDSNVSYQEYKKIVDKFGADKLVDISDSIIKLRLIKNSEELSKIKQAQKITELGYKEALKALKAGVSEIEIAALIEYVFLKNGADIAFDSIVAFGENGASPHAHRTNRALQEGDFITMDIGAKWQGYCSDMTRTVVLGGISRKQYDIYSTVLSAQELAIKNIRVGKTGAQVDKIARDVITKKGYGEYFTHSLGHGVGVDIHEKIFLSQKSTSDIIENGMVLTVEPGIYIPKFCGVRIEDTVIIEDNVAKSIANVDKKLLIL